MPALARFSAVAAVFAFAATSTDAAMSPVETQRPGGRSPVVAERPAPESLDEILRNWEEASARIQTLEATHYRWVYDRIFEIEKRGQGSIYFERPNKACIEIAPRAISKGEISQRVGKGYQPYKLSPMTGERWIWTGEKVYAVNDDQKTVELIEIPPKAQHAPMVQKNVQQASFGWWGTYLAYLSSSINMMPMVMDIHADDLKNRFDLKIENRSLDKIYLRATPRRQEDSQQFREIIVLLDLKTYLPQALKFVDPAGTLENIYKFEDWRVNQPPRGGKNPLEPNLEGYKLIVLNSAATQDAPRTKETKASEPGTSEHFWHAVTIAIVKLLFR